MPNMFELAMAPALQKLGVKPLATWEETRNHISGQARSQLSRPNIKPETVAKWHALGYITQTIK